MDDESRTVVLAKFDRRYEAETAQGFLTDAGIESAISADDAGGADLGLGFTRTARLLVLAEDEARAREVLEDAGVLEDRTGGG